MFWSACFHYISFFVVLFVCFVLTFLTFLIACEFKQTCILDLLPLPSWNFFFFPFSFFLSFLVSFLFWNLSSRFSLVRSYKGLQQFVNKKLFGALYFTTKSKSAQIIFHLLTLLLHTICDALVFSTPSPNLRHNYTVMLRMVLKTLSCYIATDQSLW